MKKSKLAFLQSAVALLLCVSMLLGSTWAWFTDTVESTNNIIQSGTLNAEMYWTKDLNTSEDDWANAATGAIFNYEHWEPGYVDIKYVKIENAGSLAFRYCLNIIPEAMPTAGEINLSDVIDVYVIENPTANLTRADLADMTPVGTLTDLITDPEGAANGVILPAEGKGADDAEEIPDAAVGTTTYCIALKMQETAGNEYQNKTVGGSFRVQLLATQYTYENDSFGSDYDADSEWPGLGLKQDVTGSATVTATDGKVSTAATIETSTDVSATIPAGVAVNDGVSELTLSVSEKTTSESNITAGETEELMALDVHVAGVSENNTTPIIINLGAILPVGLNSGNVSLYHVENGVTNTMTQVDTLAELDVHNEFYYDPATGITCVAMATFSEVAVVADTVNAWNGEFDYSWYTNAVALADSEATVDYTIANADQLAAFGAIVGGMAKDEEGNYIYTATDSEGNEYHNDDFSGKTVKLIADINLGYSEENETNYIFYPIGYYNNTGSYTKTSGGSVTSNVSSFEGTFDGNGHTIANFYQNTWEMFGDYNSGYSGTPNHYKDAMGLFGYVVNGKVCNLTVDNFSSDGEFTPTGVIAAYAVNSTFENIAITNCNPRVYNTGNGGIIGIAGNSSGGDSITLQNITVDNSNKISALWGSWDVACGGLVGMFRGNDNGSTISFTNCHVAAQIDVYNDVCANYQYYAYRYSGMIIGSVRNNTTTEDGKSIPNMTGISASGCTVHFGDWNDYYYCELVDNTTASYTHDYQMSRLVEIKAIDGTTITFLDGTTGTVPASGRANYVIVDYTKGHGTENATCYHFKDGAVWTHDMGGIQTGIDENGDGQDDLKEDKQHIYLEFNNLVTGYGWGVTSKGLTDYEGVENMDITAGEHEDSVVKFTANSDIPTITHGMTVNVGDLFSAVSDAEVAIDEDNVQVYVSPVGDDSTVAVEYKANATDWKKGTLTFSGSGSAQVIITDYNFCKETKLTISIDTIDKYKLVLPEADFLYRVGNVNAVKVGSLFTALNNEVEIDSTNVTVSVESLDTNTDVAGIFTANTSTWTEGTIKFSGTGPVEVTVSGDNGTAVCLKLEVVDATNITANADGDIVGWNSYGSNVLLEDVDITDNSTLWLEGGTLYGNGFEIDASSAAYAGVEYAYQSYVINLKNGNLNNVEIRGMVYPNAGGTKEDDYHRPLVYVSGGDCTIANCYIAYTASPIRTGGNLEIINTTLEGGTYANIDVRGGQLILDNVTTINQLEVNAQTVIGLGIVVYQEGGSDDTTITIKNKLTQYNMLSEVQANNITDTNTKTVATKIFDIAADIYQYDDGSTKWVNTGIISMNNLFQEEDIIDLRENTDGYVKHSETVTVFSNNRNCVVYSAMPAAVTRPASDYTSAGQYPIAPEATLDHSINNQVATTDQPNNYCTADGSVVTISMDEGDDAFMWNSSILAASKNGQSLSYTVTMNGTDYTNQLISFDTAGTYTVTYTYTDSNNYGVNENGDVITYDKTYTKEVTVKVVVVEAGAQNAQFTFGTDGTEYSSKEVTVTLTDGSTRTYVMPDVTATDDGKIGSTTVNGTTVYYPITEMFTSDGTTEHTGSWYACFPIFKNALQIIDYADGGTGVAVTYNQNTVTTEAGIPGTLKATNPTSAFLYSMNATNYPPPTDPTAVSETVCYTCNRNGLTASNERDEMTIIAEYTYTDNAGKTYYYYIGYHCEAQTNGGCVTEGTLFTLADGTQKAVEDLVVGDMLLVFNHITGQMEAAPVIFNNHADQGRAWYEVLHLNFSNGQIVDIVSSHGFFDMTLMEYVYITNDNYADYIGHKFYALGDGGGEIVTLTEATLEQEYTRIFCPVTYFHMNSFANGMLNTPNIPGGITGLVNYFEYDPDLKYNEEAMQRDIETYGLYTYADFSDYISEAAYNSSPAVHLKVAVGKGMITYEEIIAVIQYLLAGSLID